jgi:DNA-binding transcriptional LysR family regulator
MVLTDEGWFVLRYAERIFALGSELEQGLRGEQEPVWRVGIETSMVAGTVRPILASLAASDVRRGVKLAANVEIGDASVAAALSGDGIGLLLAPVRARVELEKRYELHLVGNVPGIHARIYAIGRREILTLHQAPLTGEAPSTAEVDALDPRNDALAG